MSPDQEEAFQHYKEGRNLFVSGQGGTGKSYLIRQICEDAAKNKTVFHVAAMTGAAAQLLEGCKATTVHRFAGIGIGDDMFARATENKHTVSRWRKASLLICDEVSMMSLTLFEGLDRIGKHIRKSPRPFGGLQLLFSGDFCQLPPVGETEQFCFESPLWAAAFPCSVILTSMHRQKDPAFCKILQEIRDGKLSKASNAQLVSLVRPSTGVTRLVPTRSKADAINAFEYSELTSEERVFETQDILDHEMNASKTYERKRFSPAQVYAEIARMRDLRFVPILKLKVGTRVMCNSNIDTAICNGSQGVIVRFAGAHPVVKYTTGVERIMWPVVVESDTIPGVAVSQVPLMYAWAITIHKAQGASLDCAEIDIGKDIFEIGQTYVALSRLRSMEGLYLTSFDASKIRISAKVVAFYNSL
jgi:ATP-dependent DNA helicase PIF1